MSTKYKVGDQIRPADGSNYRGVITFVSKDEDVVRHRDLVTGAEYEKSYFGFACRYSTLEEYDARQREIEAEGDDLSV